MHHLQKLLLLLLLHWLLVTVAANSTALPAQRNANTEHSVAIATSTSVPTQSLRQPSRHRLERRGWSPTDAINRGIHRAATTQLSFIWKRTCSEMDRFQARLHNTIIDGLQKLIDGLSSWLKMAYRGVANVASVIRRSIQGWMQRWRNPAQPGTAIATTAPTTAAPTMATDRPSTHPTLTRRNVQQPQPQLQPQQKQTYTMPGAFPESREPVAAETTPSVGFMAKMWPQHQPTNTMPGAFPVLNEPAAAETTPSIGFMARMWPQNQPTTTMPGTIPGLTEPAVAETTTSKTPSKGFATRMWHQLRGQSAPNGIPPISEQHQPPTRPQGTGVSDSWRALSNELGHVVPQFVNRWYLDARKAIADNVARGIVVQISRRFSLKTKGNRDKIDDEALAAALDTSKLEAPKQSDPSQPAGPVTAKPDQKRWSFFRALRGRVRMSIDKVVEKKAKLLDSDVDNIVHVSVNRTLDQAPAALCNGVADIIEAILRNKVKIPRETIGKAVASGKAAAIASNAAQKLAVFAITMLQSIDTTGTLVSLLQGFYYIIAVTMQKLKAGLSMAISLAAKSELRRGVKSHLPRFLYPELNVKP